MEFLASIGKLFEVRTVVVPELFDAEDTITQVAKKLKDYHRIQPIRYKIIKYRPIGVRKEYADYSVPSDEVMIKLSEIAKLNGFTDVIII
jgi:pyruvate formate lyase activating enzyme